MKAPTHDTTRWTAEQLQSFIAICHVPTVFKEATTKWPASKWTPEILSELFGTCPVEVRLHKKNAGRPVPWETECEHVTCLMSDYVSWLTRIFASLPSGHALSGFNPEVYFGYAGYMHFPEIFQGVGTLQRAVSAVDWSDFVPTRLGSQTDLGVKSTLWVGNEGCNTPCHYDSYGYNLVAQIHGTKTWHLVPPSESALMGPQRLPCYEESSVWSELDIRSLLTQATANRSSDTTGFAQDFTEKLQDVTYKVVLNEGDVLFVPRHWWHAVHSDTTSIAINMWVETAEDHAERVNESVVRLLATGLMAWTGDKSTEPRQSGVRMDPVDEQRGPDQPGASIRQTVQSEKVGLTNSPRSTNAHANRQDWMNTGETQLEADECVALVNEAIKGHLRHRGNSSGSHKARLSRDTSETNSDVASSSHGAGANLGEKLTPQHSEPTQTPVKNHGGVHKRHTTPEDAINSSAKRRKPNLYDQMTTEAGNMSSTMPYDRSAIKTDDNPPTTTYEITTTDTEDTAKPSADTHPTTHADIKSSHNIDVSTVTSDIESTVSTDEKYTTTSSTLIALSPETGTAQRKVDLSLTQITNAIVSDPTVVQAISRALVRLYESESAR